LRRAIDITRDAVRIASERLGATHYMRGYYLDSLAHLELQANDINGAEADTREALAIYAERLPPRHLYVAASRYLLGEILLRRGLLHEAESEVRAAVDIDTALAGEDSWRAARSRASLGWVLIEEGKAAEGEPLLVAAQNRLLAALGVLHPDTQQATARLVQYYQAHHREADAAQVLLLSERR
jgi:hypothetical protein